MTDRNGTGHAQRTDRNRTHVGNGRVRHIDDATLPPHNRDAERSLLGCMLRDPAIIPAVTAIVRAEHQYVVAHQIIYAAIDRLDAEGIGVDAVTVAQEIAERGLLTEVGGAAYIAELWDAAPCAANYTAYARAITETAGIRRMIHLARDIEARAADPTITHADLMAMLDGATSGPSATVERYTIGDLIAANPRLHDVIIEGIARAGEVCNIISTSKIGKSWLLYGLALSVATGRHWLDTYSTTPGRVVIIDNELHRATLAYRIREVAEAMGIPPSEYQDMTEIIPLRGRLRDLYAMEGDLRRIRDVRVIAIDAKYRMSPRGANENDNSESTQMYNSLDRIAASTGAAIIAIGHASKGDQGDKRVTDVGAGAGAQSRAADTHLVLREHEDADTVVLDAAVRSFPPIAPIALRWTFPLWRRAEGIDPTRLRRQTTAQEDRQRRNDADGIDKIMARLRRGAATARQLRETGLTRDRIERLLAVLVSDGKVMYTDITIRGNDTREYQVC